MCPYRGAKAFVGRDPKEYLGCTPEGRDCIQKIKLREDFNCSATCEGLHADVLFETDPLNKMITRGQLDNALEANNGQSKVFKYASKLIKEYRAFKKNMVRGFNFSPTLCKPILVDLIFFTVTLDFTKVHSFRKSFLV